MAHRVLICDDEVHILRAAEFKLRRAGWEVEVAGDGQEAWEKIQSQPPDIVVTDYQMPRLDGIELIQRMRQHAPTRHVPVVMLTARGFEMSPEELTQRWRVGAVMSKPFSPRELLRQVEQLVGPVHSTSPGSSLPAAPDQPLERTVP
ncbi:MAG TPA: response regulator [Planctomycetaceae bacterium]|nr:response regulator [Planctomycetaceae bacterium]HIQ20323.1 response regulator [Planctomycetota bacterium]